MVIFGADHIYRMNIRQMVEFHVEKRAECHHCRHSGKKEYASEFGVIETNPECSVVGFPREKGRRSDHARRSHAGLASMGNYIFSTELLLDELHADAQNANSSHDFGKDILPADRRGADMYAYDFQTNRIPGDPIGSPVTGATSAPLDAYYEASMDLRAVSPELNLYNRQWPLRTAGFSGCPRRSSFRRRRPARHGHRFHRFGRVHSLRRAGQGFGHGPRCEVHTGA